MQLLSNKNESTQINYDITDGVMDSACKYIDSLRNHVSHVFNISISNDEKSAWIVDFSAIDHI